MREIYLDNSATTKVLPEVREAMIRTLEDDYGNPSSMHLKGMEAEQLMRHAREQIAATLRVDEKEITFTSGGTESNNIALIGTATANHRAGKHIITTKIEHPSIANTVAYLESQGFEVTRLGTNEKGLISMEELEEAIRPDTILVSIMMVNNEIGSVQPIGEIGQRIKQCNPNTLFHVDAIQAYGKLEIRPRTMKIDLLSVSGHKIHGPKGIGFLYVREKVKIKPIVFGGEQQRGLRSGTENLPGIVGIGLAAEMMCRDREKHVRRMAALRQQLIEGLQQIPDVQVNGPTGEDAAPQIVSASFADIRSEVLLHSLESDGIYISAGSACSSNGQKHPSATLTAIQLDKKLLDSTVRFSLGMFNTEEDIRETLSALNEIVPKLRRYTRR